VSLNDQLAPIAQKVMWWEEPAMALSHPVRFVMQVMTLGTWRDVQITREVLGREIFREALVKAEPGVFDKRSWVYWHAVFGLPEKKLPHRSLK
jgi:hypothetical protein